MSIHIIPTIYEPTGEVATDADGFEYPVMRQFVPEPQELENETA